MKKRIQNLAIGCSWVSVIICKLGKRERGG